MQLDAGTDERIMLVSRDEQSCLVVSYKEIKSCIESAFGYVHLHACSIVTCDDYYPDVSHSELARSARRS